MCLLSHFDYFELFITKTKSIFAFSSYKVWLVTATTSEQRAALHHWETYEKIDLWEKLPDFEKGVRIMVAPETQPKFVKFLADANIKNELIIQNVES